MNITNPFQSFAFGVPQYGVGIGGINPMVPYLTPPYASNPIAALCGTGVNPYTLGPTQYVHPLMVAQLPTTNPTLLPLPTQYSAIGQSPYGVWGNPFSQGISPIPQLSQGISPIPQLSQGISPIPQLGQGISPIPQQGWGQQFGGGIGQPVATLSLHTFPQQPFGYPALQQGLGWSVPTPLNSPVLGLDPINGALIAQQASLLAQSQLPIRPLIFPQQPDPFQMAVVNGGLQFGSPTAGVPF